jgi:hypothetical protein
MLFRGRGRQCKLGRFVLVGATIGWHDGAQLCGAPSRARQPSDHHGSLAVGRMKRDPPTLIEETALEAQGDRARLGQRQSGVPPVLHLAVHPGLYARAGALA